MTCEKKIDIGPHLFKPATSDHPTAIRWMVTVNLQTLRYATRQSVASLVKERKVLERKIDRAVDELLDVPKSAAKVLKTKLKSLETEIEAIDHQIAQSKQKTQTARINPKGADEVVKRIRDLRKVFKQADPIQVREFMKTAIDRIELRFEHTTRCDNQQRNKLQEGTLHLSSMLAKTEPRCGSC